MERLPGDGWVEALEIYQVQRDDLYAGREPPQFNKSGDGFILADLCHDFLNAKLRKLKADEITAQTFERHKSTTDLLIVIAQFGKQRLVEDLASGDFGALRATMADRWGPARFSNEITNVNLFSNSGIRPARSRLLYAMGQSL